MLAAAPNVERRHGGNDAAERPPCAPGGGRRLLQDGVRDAAAPGNQGAAEWSAPHVGVALRARRLRRLARPAEQRTQQGHVVAAAGHPAAVAAARLAAAAGPQGAAPLRPASGRTPLATLLPRGRLGLGGGGRVRVGARAHARPPTQLRHAHLAARSQVPAARRHQCRSATLINSFNCV